MSVCQHLPDKSAKQINRELAPNARSRSAIQQPFGNQIEKRM